MTNEEDFAYAYLTSVVIKALREFEGCAAHQYYLSMMNDEIKRVLHHCVLVRDKYSNMASRLSFTVEIDTRSGRVYAVPDNDYTRNLKKEYRAMYTQ